MWPVRVAMMDEGSDGAFEMRLVQEQQPVEAVPAENAVLVATVEVAGGRGYASGTMMSVFVSVFQTRRTLAHSRASSSSKSWRSGTNCR
jgi:hypothetical protein